jgi:phenylpropionate dioxygenase-like ring-hydroxylating dioxygenase large terminal subunit
MKQRNDKNNWFAVGFLSNVSASKPMPINLFGEPLVLYKTMDGTVQCMHDWCPHRGAPLSIGSVVDGKLTCLYHGWQFGSNGECVKIPHENTIPSAVRVTGLPTRSDAGIIWVWPGDSVASKSKNPEVPIPPEKGWSYLDHTWNFDAHFGLVMENLLDPAHLTHTHASSLKLFYTGDNDKSDQIVFENYSSEGDCIYAMQKYKENSEENSSHEYIVPNPWFLEFRINFGKKRWCKQWRQVMYIFVVPVGRRRTQVLIRQYRNFMVGAIYREPLNKLFKITIGRRLELEDRRVIEAQQLRWDEGYKGSFLTRPDRLVASYRKIWEKVEESAPWFRGYVNAQTLSSEPKSVAEMEETLLFVD